MTQHCAAITVHGETLWLHPQRAVLWPARRTVIVADTHFGKSALFGRHGVAVPAGSDQHDRERLSGLVREIGAARLLILGDFLHAPLDAGCQEALDLQAWADATQVAEIRVIAGNHDRGRSCGWRAPLQWQPQDLLEPPFRFTHDADAGAAADGVAGDETRGAALFTMSGHIHPVVRLAGLRKHAPRVPVFWQRPAGLVLPSFGSFTGGYAVRPGTADHVFAVGPESVVRFS
jgi:DNA ligase-associated metallophosphoesterase